MKVMEIRVKPKHLIDRDLLKTARQIDQGIKPKHPDAGVYFESLEAVRTVLTENRLELWRTIRDKKPESISALAKIVNRNFRAVHRDLELLKNLDLIKFKRGKGPRGDSQIPISLCDKLILSVG